MKFGKVLKKLREEAKRLFIWGRASRQRNLLEQKPYLVVWPRVVGIAGIAQRSLWLQPSENPELWRQAGCRQMREAQRKRTASTSGPEAGALGKRGTGTEVGAQVSHTSCPRAQVLVGHNLPQGWPCFCSPGLPWQLFQHQV